MSRLRAWLGIVALTLLCGAPAGCRQQEPNPPEAEAEALASEPSTPYLTRRSRHETELRERGPAPASYAEAEPPAGVRRVTYPSGELELSAWVRMPSFASAKAPALVYFHGDFAFGPDDMAVVEPFYEAGFVVMTPMLRGENGNPGDFELLWGEVDDGRAAVEWLARQDRVDARRIYAFGHSVGGGVAAMLSLYPELPLRSTGSCGGVYVPETFGRWAKSTGNAKLVRFDPSDPAEVQLRTLGPNLAWMVHSHVAYVGEDDPWFIDNAAALEAKAWALGKPFELVMVPGDHMSSLEPALAAYLALISGDG